MPTRVGSRLSAEAFRNQLEAELEARKLNFSTPVDIGDNVWRVSIQGQDAKRPLTLDLRAGPMTPWGTSVEEALPGGWARTFGPEILYGKPEGMPEFREPLRAFSGHIQAAMDPNRLKVRKDPNIWYNESVSEGRMYNVGSGIQTVGGVLMTGPRTEHYEGTVLDYANRARIGLGRDVYPEQVWGTMGRLIGTAGESSPYRWLSGHVPWSQEGGLGGGELTMRSAGLPVFSGEPGNYDISVLGLGKTASDILKRLNLSRYGGVREQAMLVQAVGGNFIQQAQPQPIQEGMDWAQRSGYRQSSIIMPGETTARGMVVTPGVAMVGATQFPGGMVRYQSPVQGLYSAAYGSQQSYELNAPNIRDLTKAQFDFGIFKKTAVEGKPGEFTYEKQRELMGSYLEAGRNAIIGLARIPGKGGTTITQEMTFQAEQETYFTGNPTLRTPLAYKRQTGEGVEQVAPVGVRSPKLIASWQRKEGIQFMNAPEEEGQRSPIEMINFPGAKGVNEGLTAKVYVPYATQTAMEEKSFGVKLESAIAADWQEIMRNQPVIGGTTINAITGDVKEETMRFAGAFASWSPAMQAKALAAIPGQAGQTMQKYLYKKYAQSAGTEQQGQIYAEDLGRMYARVSGQTSRLGTQFGEAGRTGLGEFGYYSLMEEARKAVYENPELGKELGEFTVNANDRPFLPVGSIPAENRAIYEQQAVAALMRPDEESGRTGLSEEAARAAVGNILQFGAMDDPRKLMMSFRSPGEMRVGTIASTISPAHQGGAPLYGLEEAAAIATMGDEFSRSIGMSAGQGPEATGYMAPHVQSWRQIGQVYRYSTDPKAPQPTEAMNLTKEQRTALASAIAGGEKDLGVLSKIIGGGQGMLRNPESGMLIENPADMMHVGAFRYNDRALGENLDYMSKIYPEALLDWAMGGDYQSGAMEKMAYQRSRVFNAQGRRANQVMMARQLPASFSGRYGFTTATGSEQILVQQANVTRMIKDLARQAGVPATGIRMQSWMAQAQSDLGLPVLFNRFPTLARTGGASVMEMVTPEMIQRRTGINVAQGSRIGPGGQLQTGFVESTGILGALSPLRVKDVGDWDFDPAALAALGLINERGELQANEYAKNYLMTGQSNYQKQAAQLVAMFGEKAAALNVGENALWEIAGGKAPSQSSLTQVGAATIFAAGGGKGGLAGLEAGGGKGLSYNLRRATMAGAAALGLPNEILEAGHTAQAWNFQQYLDMLKEPGKGYSHMEEAMRTLTFGESGGKLSASYRYINPSGKVDWINQIKPGQVGFSRLLGQSLAEQAARDIQEGNTLPEAAAFMFAQKGTNPQELIARMTSGSLSPGDALKAYVQSEGYEFTQSPLGVAAGSRLRTNLLGTAMKPGKEVKATAGMTGDFVPLAEVGANMTVYWGNRGARGQTLKRWSTNRELELSSAINEMEKRTELASPTTGAKMQSAIAALRQAQQEVPFDLEYAASQIGAVQDYAAWQAAGGKEEDLVPSIFQPAEPKMIGETTAKSARLKTWTVNVNEPPVQGTKAMPKPVMPQPVANQPYSQTRAGREEAERLIRDKEYLETLSPEERESLYRSQSVGFGPGTNTFVDFPGGRVEANKYTKPPDMDIAAWHELMQLPDDNQRLAALKLYHKMTRGESKKQSQVSDIERDETSGWIGGVIPESVKRARAVSIDDPNAEPPLQYSLGGTLERKGTRVGPVAKTRQRPGRVQSARGSRGVVPPRQARVANELEDRGEYWPGVFGEGGEFRGMSLATTSGRPLSGLFGGMGGGAVGGMEGITEEMLQVLEGAGQEIGNLREVFQQGLNLRIGQGGETTTASRDVQYNAGVIAMGHLRGQKRFENIGNEFMGEIANLLGRDPDAIRTMRGDWARFTGEAMQRDPEGVTRLLQSPVGRSMLMASKEHAKIIAASRVSTKLGRPVSEDESGALADLASGLQGQSALASSLGISSAVVGAGKAMGLLQKDYYEPTPKESKDITDNLNRFSESLRKAEETVKKYGETHEESRQAILKTKEMELQSERALRAPQIRGLRSDIGMYEAAQGEKPWSTAEQIAMQKRLGTLEGQELAATSQERNIARSLLDERAEGGTSRQVSQATRRLIGGFGLFYMGTLARMGLGSFQEGYQEAQQAAQTVSQQAQAAFGPGAVTPFVSPEQIRMNALSRSGGGAYAGLRALTAGMPGIGSDLSGIALSGIGAMGLAMHIGTSMEGMKGISGVLGKGLFENAAAIGLGFAAVMPAIVQAGYAVNRDQSILQAAATEASGGTMGQVGAAWKMAGPTVRDWLEGTSAKEPGGTQYEQAQLVAQMRYITSGQQRRDNPYGLAPRPDTATKKFMDDLFFKKGPDYQLVAQTPQDIAQLAQVLATSKIPGIMNLPEELKSQLGITAMRAGFQGPDILSYIQGVGQSTAAGLPIQQLAQQTLALQGQIAPNVRQTATMEAMYGNAPFGANASGMGNLRRFESLPYYSPLRLRQIAAGQQLMMQTPGIMEQTYGRTAAEIDQLAEEQFFPIAGGPRQEAFLTRANVRQQAIEAGVAGARPLSATEMRQYNASLGAMTSRQRFEQVTTNMADTRVTSAVTAWNALGVGFDVANERAAMAATPAGDILQQRAQAITRQALQYGGQAPIGGAMQWAMQNVQNMGFMERVLGGSPIAINQMAMQMQNAGNIAGAQRLSDQFAVDFNLAGQQTGMGWGTTSLAKPGFTSGQMAQRIWGDMGQGSAWRQAAVGGVTLPNGEQVGGQWGLQWYMQQEGYKQQQKQAGVNLAMIALQEKYQPLFWNVEDRQRALSDQQAQWGFSMQERQAQMQRSQFQEQMALQQTQMQTTRQWARQDWGFQDQQRAMQWGWRQQDFQEQARFMTGRERRLAERGMERETIMYGLQGDEIERQRSRQKQQWQWEDEAFAQKQKHFQESMKLQDEDRSKQKEFYEEGKKLRDEMIQLQRAYWREQIAIQKGAAVSAAEYAKNMKEANDAMQLLSQEEQKQAGRQRLAQDNMTLLWNNLMEGLEWVVQHVSATAIQAAVEGGGSLGRLPTQNPGVGQNGRPDSPQPTAIGGPGGMGKYNIVGEAGSELIRPAGAISVIPNNELRAMMAETRSQDVWSNSFTNASGSATSERAQQTTIIINLGNERLGRFIVDTVSKSLDVD